MQSRATASQSSAPAKSNSSPTPAPASPQVQRLGNRNLLALLRARVMQPKLTVSDPQDAFELEADRVADQVMRTPEASLPAAQRSAPRIQRIGNEEELQRPADSANTTVDAATENSINSLSGRGTALPESVRSFMAPRFQANFDNVRVHTDAHANELARSVDAKAFTVGNNVVFGAGHYSPDSESGRRLLAHELTHVVQQGGAPHSLQRQPVDPPPPTPDEKEEAKRQEALADPNAGPIPKVDQRTQEANVNDAAARELVELIFGGAGVDESVGDLSNPVRDDMDSDVGADEAAERKAGGLTAEKIEARTQNRMRFVKRLRLYFASWSNMLKHFREIETFTSSEGPMEVILHRSAMEHFKRALATLKAKGHPMPRIVSGFQLRKAYQHEASQGGPDSAGMMVHALGFAFDAFVKGNPRITFSNSHSKGPERHAFDLMAVTVGANKTAMNLNIGGRDNQAFIAEMGARTLNEGDVSAAEDRDAKAVEYFKVFEQQFKQMLAGSQQFTQSLSPTHRDALLKLRADYFAELDARDVERHKNKPDPAAMAAHRQKLHDLLAAMPSHMAEWVAKLDAEDAKERDKHKRLNMDRLRSPTVVRADQLKNTKDIASANQKLQGAQAAAAKAQAAYRKAVAARRAARERKAAAQQAMDAAKRAPRSVRNGDWQAQDPKVDAANKALAAAEAAIAQAEEAANAAWGSAGEFSKAIEAAGAELKSLDTQRAALGTELKGSLGAGLEAKDRKELLDAWAWIDRVQELRQWLAKPDLETPGALAAFERLMVGDRSERDTRTRATADNPVGFADNPPLLRLLDIGYFNPVGAFDLAFFEEMAHHGFVPGASWNPDSVDAMHFQFAAGRNTILEPGKRK
jgi:uncharacterized protein DUF4157